MTDEFDSQLGDDILDVAPSSVHELPVVTLSGVSSPTQAQIDAGAGVSLIDHEFSEIRYRTSSSETFSQYYTKQQLIDLGLTNVNGVQTGWQFQLRLTAPSSYNTNKVAYVAVLDNRHVSSRATFGQVLIRTGPTISGSAVTATTGSATEFGLKVINTNNTIIFGSNIRSTNIVAQATAEDDLTLSANATSDSIFVEGLTATNSDEFAISVTTDSEAQVIPVTVNRFAGSFTVSNLTSETIQYQFQVIRY
mgnify:FL=1|tara:strand:+ start:69 stop:818 length:750 start_codon:yes stop_codon:yes gene_type:complete